MTAKAGRHDPYKKFEFIAMLWRNFFFSQSRKEIFSFHDEFFLFQPLDKICEFFSCIFDEICSLFMNFWWNLQFVRDLLRNLRFICNLLEKLEICSWNFDKIYNLFVNFWWNIQFVRDFLTILRFIRNLLKKLAICSQSFGKTCNLFAIFQIFKICRF